MPSTNLTPSMRKVLENLVAGRHATYGFKEGQSTAGGLTGTFHALRRRGMVEWPGTGQYIITDAGRAAL